MADFSRESMLDMFIFEMNQLLDQLEQLIIECEDGYSMDNINEIFRIMHTVKGSAAMMLYDNVSKTAHAIEDLFFFLREENPSEVDYSTLTDLVLEGMDFIKNELAKIAEGGEADSDPTEVIKRIKEFLRVLKGEEVAEDNNKQGNTKVDKEKVESKNSNNTVSESNFANKFECHLYFEDESGMENIRSFNVINNLKDFGEIIHTIPKDVTDEKSEEIIKKDGFKFVIDTDIDYEQIHEAINSTIYLKSFELKPYVLKTYKATIYFAEGCEMENVRSYTIVHNLEAIADNITYEPENVVSEDSIDIIRDKGFKINFSINKDYEEVYEMLNQTVFLKVLYLEEVEEIKEEVKEEPKEEVKEEPKEKPKESPKKDNDKAKEANKKQGSSQQMISVSIGKLDQLLNLMGELVISEAMTTQNPDLDGLELENFNKSARQLRKIIKDVQDSVMSMRMVTLDATFFKMQRIVRDMCKALGKNIELIIEGRDTEVDKNIIEKIADPLMHIIRNSVDHGVETPEERVKSGKDEKGVIKLEARNSGGEILISVKDDGAGINKEKVMAKAKSAGILKKPEEEYTDREIYQLIFHAGLSTKEAVTSYSGRGVGMDVVTANIEAVGGSIIVESEQGYGTTTILKIPLTLAIIEGMLISMGGAKYTIPIAAIQETFKIKKENIFLDPDGNEMITLRDDVFNLVRLYDFFNAPTEVKDIEEGVVIRLEMEGRTVCLFVDELIGEQQVVVKSIPKYIKKVKGISGCTLLGNGDISLIVDVAGFYDN
ncbi:chemotaxis protein CheA [uncultured Tyzzerella sp.]|uniref:chemotaxis protein CheA n=1 Tax=uncultured Tyzzerella sp. TaxID=2321398 RepID=UPI002941CF0E|nr:chemotaxis protein CheA [uncultured Tyzzerella sp.]